MVVFGQKCCNSVKLLYSGKKSCIWGRWLYLCKSGCNRTNVVVFGKN